jgi:exodeoxyribonuclease-3
MKIATFNCNSVRSRLDIVLDWLAKNTPDYLCLQETKVQDEEFPLDAFRTAGWQIAFKGQKSYNGVAIISKKPADEVSFGLDTEPADAPRLLHARFGQLHIVNTYVPQGREIDHEMYAYKLAWFARLKKYFEARFTPAIPVLWCGDLNVARQPIDVTNPQTKKDHVCYHQSVRDAFEDTIAFGFTDVFRQHNPDLVDYSFYDYRAPFNPDEKRGWRIDYILATPPLVKKCTGSAIDITPRTLPKPSDHTPLTADFRD